MAAEGVSHTVRDLVRGQSPTTDIIEEAREKVFATIAKYQAEAELGALLERIDVSTGERTVLHEDRGLVVLALLLVGVAAKASTPGVPGGTVPMKSSACWRRGCHASTG